MDVHASRFPERLAYFCCCSRRDAERSSLNVSQPALSLCERTFHTQKKFPLLIK